MRESVKSRKADFRSSAGGGARKTSGPRRELDARSTSRRGPDEDPGVGAGERWETGHGDGGRLYIVGVRRVAIADFGLGGKVPSDVAHERARLAAQAPLMYEALLDIISGARGDGFFSPSGHRGNPVHRVGCECGMCQGLRALVLVEGGGRCFLCGCTQDDACGEGCAWVDRGQLLCDAHPPKVIAAARAFIRRGLRHG